MFLTAEIDGQVQEIQITVADINNGNVTNSIVGYDSNNQGVFEDVVDLFFPLSFGIPPGSTSITYSFSLATTNGAPFPIHIHDDLMSVIKPIPGMTSYSINTTDQVVEAGTKHICPRSCDFGLPAYPLPRLNTTLSSLSSPVVTPNPFDHSVIVNYETLSPSNSTLIELIDIQGKTVQQQISNDTYAGRQFVALNTKELSAGMYLCRISNSEGVKTVKLLKQTE